MADTAVRKSALSGRHGGSASVRLTPAPNASRVALRAPEGSLKALSSALGVTIPATPKTSGRKDGRSALWLGPDEWLLIDETGGDLMAALAKIGAAFGNGCFPPQRRDRRIRSRCRSDDFGRLPAGSVARRLPGRRLHAHAFRQGRDRPVPDGRRHVPR